ASQYRIERDRGAKEAAQQIEVLRERWPLAFPVKDEDVRPLAIAAASEIAAVMDWSIPYTLGVLRHWKMAAAYCQAVLCHEHRITLDGAPAEAVGTEAKDLAARQLAKLAARKAAKKAAKAPEPVVKRPPVLSRPSRNQKGSAQDSQQPRSYGLILADPPIHGRPNLPADAGASEENPMGSSLLRHADHGTRHPDAPANSWHFLSRVRLSGTKELQ
ncbi:MAG TPA: ProQ/FINO family protein, partial [Stellaceae bacterium]|nr:ProQ/FINO family protein [Stellaceae bacterium]